MNILAEIATAKRNQNQKIVMKRERFGKLEKTKRCGAPDCKMPGTTIKFGKEVRILCRDHLQQLNRKHEKYTVTRDTFKKASEL